MSAVLSVLLLLAAPPTSPDDPWHPFVAPTLRFTSPTSAVVEWDTRTSMPSRVLFGEQGARARTVSGRSSRNHHTVKLKGLVRGRKYTWRVMGNRSGKRLLGAEHMLDTGFNFVVAPVADGPDPWGDEGAGKAAAKRVRTLLESCGVDRGYAVVWGAGDGRDALALARQSELVVICLEPDVERVRHVRQGLYRAGAYGHRVTVRHVPTVKDAALTRCFANLVLVLDGAPTPDEAALRRIVRPDGGVLVEGGTVKWKRPQLEGVGSWTHLYGQPDNAANSGDELLGATEASQFDVQWLGRPGPDAMTDRNPRKPSPLAAAGRVFTQGLKRIIAQDQYNGAILWTLEMPDLQRVNMPRDCANWCADREFLYLAVREMCLKIDAATGRRVDAWPVRVGKQDAGAFWGYLASLGDQVLGSSVRPDAVFTNIFGGSGEAWADATKGPVTRKVLSDALFAAGKAKGERKWRRSKGLVINPTITVGGGTLYFLECRNKKVMDGAARAVESPELWKDLWLVALDPSTGKQQWEREVAPTPGSVVVYLTWAQDTLLLLCSGSKYHLYGYAAADGKDLWHQSHGWPNNNHGRHMQHPAVVGDVVYVRPRGYKIADGSVVTEAVPDGGCGTISACASTLMFRAGNIRMWDPQSGKSSDWARLRPGCWLSTITAGGMLLAPEAGGGCSCAGWFETSIGFLRKEEGQ
ncbi:MAG: PQQ-binding-like beta-propeller repeat protein [Planctomycetes bacterium]|nr:PQQ-binding-like beta-propeller repeat protein [Planctomycetota bacterium]